MPPTATMAEVPNTEIFQVVESAIVLAAPMMGYWHGTYQLKPATDGGVQDGYRITISGHEIDAAQVTTPQAKLLEASETSREWKARFQSLANARSRLVKQYSEPYRSLQGTRIFNRSRAPAFFAALIGKVDEYGRPRYNSELEANEQSVAYQLGRTAEEFVAAYDDVMASIARNIDPMIWRLVKDSIPGRDAMRAKFYLDVTPVEITTSRTTAIGQQTLADYETYLQEAARRRAAEIIEQVVAGPRQQLAEALTDLRDLVSRDGRVTSRSFAPVRAAIEKIRMFDFVSNSDLMEQVEALELRLGKTDAKTLDPVTATNNGLFSAIDAVRREVTDNVKQAEDIARFGRPLRGIDL